MKINANKAIIISDTHLGARSNSAEWLTTMTDWFREDFIPRAKELYEPGTVLIHTGDVFDNRQSINLMVLHEGMSLFEELSQIFDAIYIIAGNHDVMKKTSNDISSLDCLKYIPKVHIIKEPTLADINGTKALFMPWRTDVNEEKSCIANFGKEDPKVLFCHTNIYSLKFDNSRDVEEGLHADDLKTYEKVYSGHIHWGQKRGNVTMVGNPYQMTRSDAGNPKGFYEFNFKTFEETFHENTYSPRFVRVHLNRYLENTLGDILDECKNNRVDLYVPSHYILKYQVNPIIDAISEVSRKLEVFPFEEDQNIEIEGSELETLSIFEMCQKYITQMRSVDDSVKKRIESKISKLYNQTIKEI